MQDMARTLTVREVAALLRVTPPTVRRWIKDGRLPAVRAGLRSLRIREEDAAAMVASVDTTEAA